MDTDDVMDRDDDGKRGGKGRGGPQRRKLCRFCAENATPIDYKNPQLLRGFITDRGKMIPRRISGTCALHQRAISLSVRRARMLALMPFCVTGD
jgi:small subunit ribosomal protein S18